MWFINGFIAVFVADLLVLMGRKYPMRGLY